MHVTKMIRDAVIEYLGLAVPALKKRVYGISRLIRPMPANTVPAAVVVVSETVLPPSPGDLGPGYRTQDRALEIVVRVIVRGDLDEPEDLVDALRVEVEKAMHRPGPLGVSNLANWAFRGASSPIVEETKDGFQMSKSMRWECLIRTSDSDPETII